MIISVKVVETRTYQSEVKDEIRTTLETLAPIIEWADKTPILYDIVMQTKSGVWGKTSSHYLGNSRGDDVWQVLDRLRTFKRDLDRSPDESFFSWLAHHTVSIYGDKKFKSGFMVQFDGKYNRGCSHVDYTPKTLETVVAKFKAWCDGELDKACAFPGQRYHTQAILLDGAPVWTGCDHPSRTRKLTGEVVCDVCGYTIQL
jgi:hypothetical protein